ncbi:hypothetical protein ABPG77_002840 [Micractinium sp. CCAP 211/92]
MFAQMCNLLWQFEGDALKEAELAALGSRVRELCLRHAACAEELVSAAASLTGKRLQQLLAALTGAGEGLLADFLRSALYNDPMEESSTPTQQLITPHIPAAPSKSGSSLESRPRRPPTSTARSLAPLFHAFTPAAARAAQLGAHYVTLRRDSKAMARLQQRAASISPDASGSGGQQPRKRARIDAVAQEDRVQQRATAQQAGQPQGEQQQGRQPQVRHPLQELALSPDVGSSWLVSAAQPRPRRAPAPDEA